MLDYFKTLQINYSRDSSNNCTKFDRGYISIRVIDIKEFKKSIMLLFKIKDLKTINLKTLHHFITWQKLTKT